MSDLPESKPRQTSAMFAFASESEQPRQRGTRWPMHLRGCCRSMEHTLRAVLGRESEGELMPESTQKPDLLSDEALEALERAARAASPGDWWYKHFRRDDEIQLYEQGGSVVAKVCDSIDDQDIANFELIIALKNAAPLLIAAARENAELRLRVAELEAIVAKLPRTADGVPVVPGMEVWSPSRSPSDDPTGKRGYYIGSVHTAGRKGWAYDALAKAVGPVYSTREAALVAQGGGA